MPIGKGCIQLKLRSGSTPRLPQRHRKWESHRKPTVWVTDL